MILLSLVGAMATPVGAIDLTLVGAMATPVGAIDLTLVGAILRSPVSAIGAMRDRADRCQPPAPRRVSRIAPTS